MVSCQRHSHRAVLPPQVLSLQHSGSDSSHAQFAAYWKPVLSMDANSWQRWLHMHRLVLILDHDTCVTSQAQSQPVLPPTVRVEMCDHSSHPFPRPIPKHLHTPGSNGRYSTVQCRISHSSLTSLLRDWSSFVLVEGYSYVKLLYRCAAELLPLLTPPHPIISLCPMSLNHLCFSSAPDQPPFSFYMVRIISKAPCMVLRLGFPIGTPAQARHKVSHAHMHAGPRRAVEESMSFSQSQGPRPVRRRP